MKNKGWLPKKRKKVCASGHKENRKEETSRGCRGVRENQSRISF